MMGITWLPSPDGRYNAGLSSETSNRFAGPAPPRDHFAEGKCASWCGCELFKCLIDIFDEESSRTASS